MKHNVQMMAHARMQKMQKEYATMMTGGAPSFSLLQLFNYGDFRLEEYCRSFKKHPFASSLAKAARSFGEEYNIWLNNAEHYITCAIFLFPDASLSRMLPIVKNLAVDYYLNDTMGREVFDKLSPQQQVAAKAIVDRMSAETVMEDQCAELAPIEIANRDILQQMRTNSPSAWFDEFLRLYAYHIKVTHRNGNVSELGRIPSVAEYTDLRCHMAGMHHVISLIDYSIGGFTDHAWLNQQGIASKLSRLQYVTAAIGGLMNDLFSFEKEMIDNSADSNLIAVVALNYPNLPLDKVLKEAGDIVQGLLREFMLLLEEMNTVCMDHAISDPQDAEQLRKHLDGLERCVQASWVWQVHTLRYKRPQSIWLETQLTTEMRKAV